MRPGSLYSGDFPDFPRNFYLTIAAPLNRCLEAVGTPTLDIVYDKPARLPRPTIPGGQWPSNLFRGL